jgi:hypothetical protein
MKFILMIIVQSKIYLNMLKTFLAVELAYDDIVMEIIKIIFFVCLSLSASERKIM